MTQHLVRVKRLNVSGWLYSLLASAISSGATAASAWLALAAARSAGLDVPSLNFKALGIIVLSGALPAFFAVLAKSPLPPVEDIEPTNETP